MTTGSAPSSSAATPALAHASSDGNADVDSPPPGRTQTLLRAVALSLGSAIALGLARFAYALLLPAMKADLGWSFAQAGSMNTANALGYLIGALVLPTLARRYSSAALFSVGTILTALLMACAGLTADTQLLLAQRVVTGATSALIFITGGLLAARLASSRPQDAGLVIGVYYGGTGWGIVASAVLVPLTLTHSRHGWQIAWYALAVASIACAFAAIRAARAIEAQHGGAQSSASSAAKRSTDADAPGWTRYAWMLLGYGMFGVGYIGYMTFIVALLRTAGLSAGTISAFYIALGLATVVSARIWSTMLDRMRGGQALAVLNALLGVATLLPIFFAHPAMAFVSGVLFGSAFLSAVASTTAFVRHNLPAQYWARGISIFTIVFAFGQIVGPVVIGRISDGAGLGQGLAYSAGVLLIGTLLAVMQRPLRAAPR